MNPSLDAGCYSYGEYALFCDGDGSCVVLGCGSFTPTYAVSGASCTKNMASGACDGAGHCVVGCVPTTEACNGFDDDCDALVDEGCDDDDDEYCDSSMTRATGYACSGSGACCPAGGGDCVDADPAINPAAAESCNGADDDCDGSVDEGDLCGEGSSCVAGSCVGCVDACVPGARGCAGGVPWVCGEAGDGDACLDEVFGASCGEGSSCVDGSCVSTVYAVSVSDVLVTAGDVASLEPVLVPGRDAFFTYTGWMTTQSVVTTNTDVGTHSVTVRAHDALGLLLAAAEADVVVACNPLDPVYGPCCEDGDYLPDDSACTVADPLPGGYHCLGGACTRWCAPGATLRCRNNKVTWYDTCGEPGDTLDDCDLGARTCVETPAPPHCEDAPPACTGAFTYECRGQAGYQVDASRGISTREPCAL